jgi:hypothetical protein
METLDEIVDKTLNKEDDRKSQYGELIKLRDKYNETGKKDYLGKFRKLYKKIKDSLTEDEDEELVESLSGKMYDIYLEININDLSEPEPIPEPEPDPREDLRELRVSQHIKTLGKSSLKPKKSIRRKSKKRKSKKRRNKKSKKK